MSANGDGETDGSESGRDDSQEDSDNAASTETIVNKFQPKYQDAGVFGFGRDVQEQMMRRNFSKSQQTRTF